MICGMTAGCEGKKDKNVDNITLETGNLAPATLTFYLAGTEKKDTKEVLDRIAATTYLNISLNFKWANYGNYSQKVKSALAANEDFDAFLCGRPEPGGINVFEMLRNNQVKDITELLPAYAPLIFRGLSEEELEAAKIEGKIIYIPPLLPPSVEIPGFYIRKDIADKYNISTINTFNDYEILLKKIKKNEENDVPGFIMGGNNYNIDFFANAYGYVILDYSQFLVYKWDDPDMRIIPWEETPEFVETTDFISKWYKNGYIQQTTGQKKIASFISIGDNYHEGPIDIDFFDNGDKEVYNHYIPYKNMKIQKKSIFNNFYIGSVAFNSNSKNTERSLMFLDWIQSSQDNYDLFNYGIKDRHYILKGGRIGMPEGMNLSENPYWWHGLDNELLNMAFMNVKFNRSAADDPFQSKDSTNKDYAEFLHSYTSYAPHEGFYPDYRNVQDQCNSREQIYQNKIIDAFQRNAYDTNETANIIDELKKAGSDRIVEEIQGQLDKWRTVNNK